MSRSELDFKIQTFDPDKRGGSHGGNLPSRKRWLQWNLLTLFLLICAFAAWFLYYRLSGQNQQMRVRIEMMRAELRPLVIVHTDRAAVVKAAESWFEEEKWELALPTSDAVAEGGAAYTLCLATSGLMVGRLPSEVTEFALPHGRHTLELEISETETGYDVTVLLDDERVIKVNQLHNFGASRTASQIGGAREPSYQLQSVTSIVDLYTMFYVAGQSNLPIQKPCHGVQMWLQPVR